MKRNLLIRRDLESIHGLARCRAGLLMVGAVFAAQAAHAACVSRTVPGLPIVVPTDMGTVTVPSDLAVGATIKYKEFTVPLSGPSVQMFDCNSGSITYAVVKGNPQSNNIFSTNLPGIGIRFSHVGYVYYPYVASYGIPVGYYFNAPMSLGVELIKTADKTGNGALEAGDYTRIFGDGGGLPSVITTTMTAGGTRVISPSCSVDAGSRKFEVPLGNVSLQRFKGVGSAAGDRAFNINLMCSRVGDRNTVHLRLDAAPDPSNQQGVLQITQGGAGVASGVGIQVLDKSSAPVKFGDDVLVGLSMDGGYSLQYTARYIQTSSKVTPGTANGSATFTLSYK